MGPKLRIGRIAGVANRVISAVRHIAVMWLPVGLAAERCPMGDIVVDKYTARWNKMTASWWLAVDGDRVGRPSTASEAALCDMIVRMRDLLCEYSAVMQEARRG